MTSQTWLSPEEVSRSVWWHILVVVVPHNLRITDMATLWVTDGSNKDDFIPDLGAQFDYNLLVAADIATASGIIVANLYQIPNAVTHSACLHNALTNHVFSSLRILCTMTSQTAMVAAR